MNGTGIEIYGREIVYGDVICLTENKGFVLTPIYIRKRKVKRCVLLAWDGSIFEISDFWHIWKYLGKIEDYPGLKRMRDSFADGDERLMASERYAKCKKDGKKDE